MNKVWVDYWKFYDGFEDINSAFATPRGYSCWVYTNDTEDFLYWMKENMTGTYDATPRFNGGNPMITVFIKEDQDATAFTLKWR